MNNCIAVISAYYRQKSLCCSGTNPHFIYISLKIIMIMIFRSLTTFSIIFPFYHSLLVLYLSLFSALYTVNALTFTKKNISKWKINGTYPLHILKVSSQFFLRYGKNFDCFFFFSSKLSSRKHYLYSYSLCLTSCQGSSYLLDSNPNSINHVQRKIFYASKILHQKMQNFHIKRNKTQLISNQFS